MATIRVYKRNSVYIDLSNLAEELSNLGLTESLSKYYGTPFEHEAKSIVAGPNFMQFLNKLFKIQIAADDILQFESNNNKVFYILTNQNVR